MKTFKKEFKQTIYDILEYTDYDKFIAINGIEREIDKLNTIEFNIEDFYKFTRGSEELQRMFRIAYNNSLIKTDNLTYQAMEAFVHNLNSICNARSTTVNLGTDTTKEARMITSNLFRTIKEGIGENKKATFPTIVFKIKDGTNYNEKDRNYDLLIKACELVSKTENISFSFLNSQYNAQYYKEGDFNTEVAYFDDGTRIIDNYADPDKKISSGRGVLSSTTINLPRIALKHEKNANDFFEELEQKMDTVKDQLLERLEIQSNKKVYNFPFLMKQNVWMDSEKLKNEDKVKKVLKNGILRISFVGLNECLKALETNELGIKIIAKMREKTNEYSKKYNLTFELSGDYNEKTAQDFLEFDRAIFGKIKGVTDKEKYSCGFDIESTCIEKKIEKEAPFHEYTNGGHVITIKIEKEATEKITIKVMKIINSLYKNEIGYAKISIL